MKSLTPIALTLAAAIALVPLTATAACGPLLDHTMQRLHSSEQVDICQELQGKPAVIVNTASHCGFTYQFEGLEALHQRYRDRGVGFLGVASDSFHQAASTEAEAAQVCYINYGVTFTMLAPVPVTGSDAHPLFQEISAQSSPPTWNFNKFVVDHEGNVVERFGSSVAPDDPQITELLERLITNVPAPAS